MSDEKIESMDFKELRKHVRALNDELVRMKRQYEDILYNLDASNFSQQFVKEQNNMRTEIAIAAGKIKTMVSQNDLKGELEKYSTIEQTAEIITSTVTEKFVNELIGDTYVTNATLLSEIEQTADEIRLTVSETYETKEDAEDNYNGLSDKISEVSLTAGVIETKVSDLEIFKESVFTQTADGFTLDGEQTTFTGVIYLTDNNEVKRFAISVDESQGPREIFMNIVDGTDTPIVLGSSSYSNVYIGNSSEGQRIATQSWVLANAGSDGIPVAVFG